jgi:hypothetical protein
MMPLTPSIPKYKLRAATLLYEALLPVAPSDLATRQDELADLLVNAEIPFSTEEKKALWAKRWRQRSPPDLVPRLTYALGPWYLAIWAARTFSRLLQHLGRDALTRTVRIWFDSLPVQEAEKLSRATIYRALNLTGNHEAFIQFALGSFLSETEVMMNSDQPINDLVKRLMEKYFFDTGNALPQSFADSNTQQAYIRAVGQVLARFTLDIGNEGNDTIVAAIIGTLLQLGRTQAEPASAFEADVRQAWARLFTKELGNSQPNNEIYAAAELVMRADRPGQPLSYQEYAYVGDALSTGETRVPPTDPNFAGLVRVAAQNYLAQRTTFGGLGDLPPLISEDSGDNEIVPDNVRAVAWVYAARQYEQMRLFDVVDRITELFMNGLLPIGLDSGGHALDRYYWDSEDRLTPAARYSHYSRVLGTAGGNVSREVQPNGEFNNLWLRFLSSLAEYDRQFRMADLFQQRRGLATTGEHVRKAGRDLAANASLYGWAATHFVARRLEKQIRDTIGILRLPSIQKAYAVSSPWQVIERVAAMEFGQAPNMVRFDTMARAGKVILDIVAKNARHWSRTTGNPLFAEDVSRQAGDISDTDRMALMTQTQYWLAVNGVKDDEINQLSQPVASAPAPSIPTAGRSVGSPDIDQLRQMVTQGQMPSLDQLQRIVGIDGVSV